MGRWGRPQLPSSRRRRFGSQSSRAVSRAIGGNRRTPYVHLSHNQVTYLSHSLNVWCVQSPAGDAGAESWPRFPDYAIFASHDFNPNDYAHAVLAGEPYPSQSASKSKAKLSAVEPAKEDISVAITKLSSGIDDVSKQLKSVVSLFRG